MDKNFRYCDCFILIDLNDTRSWLSHFFFFSFSAIEGSLLCYFRLLGDCYVFRKPDDIQDTKMQTRKILLNVYSTEYIYKEFENY